MKLLLDADRELECHEETLKEMVQKLTRGDNMVCRCLPFLVNLLYSSSRMPFSITKTRLRTRRLNTTRRLPGRSTPKVRSTGNSANLFLFVSTYLYICSSADCTRRRCKIPMKPCRPSQIFFLEVRSHRPHRIVLH